MFAKSNLMFLKVKSCLWLCYQFPGINPMVHMVLSHNMFACKLVMNISSL